MDKKCHGLPQSVDVPCLVTLVRPTKGANMVAINVGMGYAHLMCNGT